MWKTILILIIENLKRLHQDFKYFLKKGFKKAVFLHHSQYQLFTTKH
jgi:hypothetical protein